MNTIDLHIISFDVPLPENYGGVIDVFNRIKTLHKYGVGISLHCFQYGRKEEKELENYCIEVNYYKRNLSLHNLMSSLPFIVVSRKNSQLINNLLKNNAPILFEGHHSCYYLNDNRLVSRMKLIRTHNVEHDYYRGLSASTSSFFKRLYYRMESKKLLKFEENLRHAQKLFPISITDTQHYLNINSETYHLKPFHPFTVNKKDTQVEGFAIYHGNLAVEENVVAAEFLIEVFAKLNCRLIIAGRKPAKTLIHLSSHYKNIEIVVDPEEEELKRLIQTAKINCLYTRQSTGIKLKLIRALIEGNIVMVNNKMVEGTALESFCQQAENIETWREKIKSLMESKIDVEKLRETKSKVAELYDNDRNIQAILKLLDQ